MNEQHSSPDFEEVGRQFRESDQLLRKAYESLQNLLADEERMKSQEVALSDAANAVAGYSTAARDLLNASRNTLTEAEKTLEVGRNLIDGTALRQIQKQVQKIDEEIGEIESRFNQRIYAISGTAIALLILILIFVVRM